MARMAWRAAWIALVVVAAPGIAAAGPDAGGAGPAAAECRAAVLRIVSGHGRFDAFTWDAADPRRAIRSTMLRTAEFRGKQVLVDYTLILVGQLRERGTGNWIDGNGVCGVRDERVVGARVAASLNR